MSALLPIGIANDSPADILHNSDLRCSIFFFGKDWIYANTFMDKERRSTKADMLEEPCATVQ